MTRLTRRQRYKKQHNALNYARIYARTKSLERCEGWLERAVKFKPLTEMQWFRFRQILGATQANTLRERVCPGAGPLWE